MNDNEDTKSSNNADNSDVLERISRISDGLADFMKTVQITHEINRNREACEAASKQGKVTKKGFFEKLNGHKTKVFLFLSSPISILWLICNIKSHGKKEVPLQSGEKEKSIEPPVWWIHGRKKFFSTIVLAEKFWPRSHDTSNQQQQTKIDQKVTKKESDKQMKAKDERVGKKVLVKKHSKSQTEDVGISCTLIKNNITIENVMEEIQGFTITLTSNGDRQHAAKLHTVESTSQSKYIVQDWPSKLELFTGHPVKDLTYHLNVYVNDKKGNAIPLKEFGYSYDQITIAYDMTMVEAQKPSPKEIKPEEVVIQVMKIEKGKVPDEVIKNLTIWLKQISQKNEKTSKPCWNQHIIDDIVVNGCNTIEEEIKKLQKQHDDLQLEKLLDIIKAIRLSHDALVSAREVAKKAQKPVEQPVIVPKAIVTSPPAEDTVTASKVAEIVAEAVASALAKEKQKQQEAENTERQRVAKEAAEQEKASLQSKKASSPFLAQMSVFWNDYASWLPQVLIVAMLAIIMVWGIPASWWSMLKPSATPSVSHSSGGIPITPENDPSKLPTILIETNSSTTAPVNKVEYDKGGSIGFGNVTGSNIITAIIVHGDYNNTTPNNRLQNKQTIDGTLIELKPKESGERIPYHVSARQYVQFRIPEGWSVRPYYHLPKKRGSNEECLNRYADGQQVDLNTDIIDQLEGYLNKMDNELLIEFECTKLW